MNYLKTWFTILKHCFAYRPHKKPKMRVQMMENLSRVFQVLEAQEVKVVNVGKFVCIIPHPREKFY